MVLYVESLTSSDYQLTKRRLYHFLPFFVFLLISGSFSQQANFSAHLPSSAPTKLLELGYLTFLLLSLVYYSAWMQILLKQHRARVLDYFAQSPNRISLTWLSWIVYLFFVAFVLIHLIKVLILLNLFRFYSEFQAIFEVSVIPFLCILSYFGVRQSQVFHERFDGSDEAVAEEPQSTLTEKDKPTGRRFVLQDQQLDDYLVKLEDFVGSEKPYLDSELTLGDLAEMVEMPKHHLTETLNRKLQKNFYSYVNEYRIAEVKSLLLDPQNASATITTLAYQVGFNSRSAFNNFFKKTTQMTPTQFRKTAAGES
jgi:AraC-like DNA-binding protein